MATNENPTLLTLLDSREPPVLLTQLLPLNGRRHVTLCHRAAQSELREQLFARGVWVLPPSVRHLAAVSTVTRNFIKDVIVRDAQSLKLISSFPDIKTVTVRSRYKPYFVERELEVIEMSVVDLAEPWPCSITKLDLSEARLKKVSKLGELTQLETLQNRLRSIRQLERFQNWQ